jgi:hypothetical protein
MSGARTGSVSPSEPPHAIGEEGNCREAAYLNRGSCAPHLHPDSRPLNTKVVVGSRAVIFAAARSGRLLSASISGMVDRSIACASSYFTLKELVVVSVRPALVNRRR